MENRRDRVDLKLVEREIRNLADDPNLETINQYLDNLIACHLKKTK